MKKFETIKDWLEEDRVNYDFVKDTQGKKPKRDYGEIKQIYEKFLIYKYTGKIDWSIIGRVDPETNFKNIDEYITKDPDGHSQLLQKVYQRLWPELAEKEYMISGKLICSDTMTSAWRRFQDALNAIINSKYSLTDIDKKTICRIREIYEECDKRQKRKQEWWSTNLTILVAAELGSDFYEMIDKRYSEMKSFLEICHTIGNFCPVPDGFNTARSGGGHYDYWDLTLMKIHYWYMDKDEKHLNALLRIKTECARNSQCRENCKKWLAYFGQGQMGWHNFVDTLYMQDYVYNEDNRVCENYKVKKDNKVYYDVIPFWEGHGWNNIGMPDDIGDKEKAFKTMTGMIRARSERIVEALRGEVDAQK